MASDGLNDRIDTTVGPWKRPGCGGRDRGFVHGHVAAVIDVAHGDAGPPYRIFEGEGATQHEGHQVVAPQASLRSLTRA